MIKRIDSIMTKIMNKSLKNTKISPSKPKRKQNTKNIAVTLDLFKIFVSWANVENHTIINVGIVNSIINILKRSIIGDG